MNEPPDNRCGYTWPEGYDADEEDDAFHQNCCYREVVSTEVGECIWHADTNEVDEQSVEMLKRNLAPSETRFLNSPYTELLDGSNLVGTNLSGTLDLQQTALRDADLIDANLTDANLAGADLTEADLMKANLTKANLWTVDFTNATLQNAKIKDANLRHADLIDADLWYAECQDTDFRYADFRRADCQHTNLDSADFRHATLTDAELSEASFESNKANSTTTVKQLYEGDNGESENWDATARAYHNLKTIFADHGLVGKARDMHVRERRARRLEEKAESGRLNRTYLGSLISRWTTGYGVRMSPLLGWMLLIFLGATTWYNIAGVKETFLNNMFYSVIAFTAAPPPTDLTDAATQIIVMIETFLGTLMIVLLGYILGNREQF
ncbi:Uncharacterized protein YjbI, contains pentapeptide repeats [Halovenus aranensis]|uniref:Uncharacterized protein YjbI, contains pentapeptide repeats n=1 Tax=Halovenus aranensis TaxID=890420 RepID=A0A1G8UIT0_9EURY|nr:pentapeptide repeat-containing protein [Halovenus aranensis]SDJ52820.1 Uncharacterized protein YjbI, contains pentapeptide repeats [Halovenus aranensis]